MRWRLTLILSYCYICLNRELIASGLDNSTGKVLIERKEGDNSREDRGNDMAERAKDDDDDDEEEDTDDKQEEHKGNEGQGNESDDDDEDDDDDDEDVVKSSSYIMKVKTDDSQYTGTIIASTMIVTDFTVGDDKSKISICNMREKECGNAQEIEIVEEEAFIKLGQKVSEPLVAASATGRCQAVGISHANILVTVKGSEVNCDGCENYDAIVCGRRLAGLLKGAPKFQMVGVNVLRKKGGIKVNEDDEEDINMIAQQGMGATNTEDKQYQDSGEDWLSVRKSGEEASAAAVSRILLLVVGLVIYNLI